MKSILIYKTLLLEALFDNKSIETELDLLEDEDKGYVPSQYSL